ncbi:hypothetical protein [Pseudomonas sp. TCU-HL1]|uniref:hypothetical protein n=1 Tax=Pseudomonas sp. TCU-HL1 TaxID=1856685 RepID=UPI00300128E7
MARIDERLHCRRIADGLVDDQVADHSRLGIEHGSTELLIGGELRAGNEWIVARAPEERVKQARKQDIGGPEPFLSRNDVVEGSVECTEAEWDERVGQQVAESLTRCMGFSDQDLLKNEFKVRLDEVGHGVLFLNPTAISQAESRPRGCDSTFR